MAPSYVARQDNSTSTSTIPACVTTCMAEGSLGNCTSYTDYTCLCTSATYTASVLVCHHPQPVLSDRKADYHRQSCWESTCTSADDVATGEAYSAAGCAEYGVNVTTTSIASATATSLSTATSTAAPNTIPQSVRNVSAVMTSICTVLFVIALGLGINNCRPRIRRERTMSQNQSWTGAGSTMNNDTKDYKTSKFNRSTDYTSRAQTSTFASDNFGVTSSNFGGQSVPFPQTSRGFTNRLTVGNMNLNESQEWETEDKDGDKLDSPVTPTSAMGAESEIDLSSTTHLNVLPKVL
ncbi:hypothetical protein P7C73_g5925, partial [Tremellales sp. Uapishka_1]